MRIFLVFLSSHWNVVLTVLCTIKVACKKAKLGLKRLKVQGSELNSATATSLTEISILEVSPIPRACSLWVQKMPGSSLYIPWVLCHFHSHWLPRHNQCSVVEGWASGCLDCTHGESGVFWPTTEGCRGMNTPAPAYPQGQLKRCMLSPGLCCGIEPDTLCGTLCDIYTVVYFLPSLVSLFWVERSPLVDPESVW